MDASVVSKPTGSPNTTPIAKGETKLINLSLQGGGAHGAFTSGVLDCLVEGDCIEFHGISATSSDAMNATVFPSRMAAGNRQVYRGCDRQNGGDLSVAASADRLLTR
jgi:predicted acylesterase/phospholipase RssA